MNNTTQKSANQLYKESGTTLSFKDWIEREKTKGVHIPNVEANAEMMSMLGEDEEKVSQTKQPMQNKVLVRNIAIGLTIVILAGVAYRFYMKGRDE